MKADIEGPPGSLTGNEFTHQENALVSDKLLRLAWLPIPLFLVVFGFLWFAKHEIVFEPPYLLPILNFIFSTTVSLFIACLAAFSFARNAAFPVLLMGAGMLFFGAVSLIAGISVHLKQINLALTVYNTGMCLSGICHVMAAAASVTFERINKNALLVLIGVYGFVLALTGLLTYAAFEGVTPSFFIQGQGGTELRQAVLGSAVGLFGLAGAMVAMISRKNQWQFGKWYALSLGLIATGLFGVLIISNVGSPLGWAGRAAQYLGGIYMFGAVIVAARENGEWDAALQVELKEKERLFRTIVENSRDGIHQFDILKGKYIFMSPAQEKLTGFSCAELMLDMEDAAERLHPDDREKINRYMGRLIAGEEMNEPMVYRWRVKSGEYRWFSDTRSVVRDEQGRPVALIGNSRDITDKKNAEKAIRQLNESLEERVTERTELADARARQLQRLAVDLIEAEEKERQKIAQVLHDDLQQLLAGARLQLQTAMSQLPPTPSLETIEQLLLDSIKKSRNLSHELSPPVLHHSDLYAALKWLVARMKEQFGLNVELVNHGAQQLDNLPMKVFLFRAVQEILFNTVKHSGVNNAKVVLTNYDQELCITISDQGQGFNPDCLGENGSSGLGLASLRERAQSIGGSLAIKSSQNQGSQLTLVVPVDTTETFSEDNLLLDGGLPIRRRNNPGAELDAETGSVIRVLFADDHKVMRQGLIGLVDGQPGISVVGEAAHGEEAVKKTRQLMPDVVVMDISMPKMDGLEATRQIKSEIPEVCVIGLSMHDDDDIARKMKEAGADAFVTKTASSSELMKVLYETGGQRRNGKHCQFLSYTAQFSKEGQI